MRNRILLVFLAVTLAVSLVLFVGACAKPAPAAKTLKIGVIYSLTGPFSDVEKILRDGTDLAAAWINGKGGITINGEKYTIELIVEDQKGNVDGAVAAATKLVQLDGVKFIVGQCVPDTQIAAASVTEPAKVLRSLAYDSGIPPIMNPDTPYTFISALSGPDMIPSNYAYLVKAYPNVKTVALMDPDDPGGQFFMAISKQNAEGHGFTVVDTESYPTDTQDFYPLLTKMLAAKPDAIDIGSNSPEGEGSIIKTGRELGFTGPMFSHNQGDLYAIRNIAGKDFSYDYFNAGPDIKDPNLPSMFKEIEKRWAAKFGTAQFRLESVSGWDPLWCMTQAMEKAQSLDPTAVAAAWEKMDKIETAWGTGHMGGLQTRGINHLLVHPLCMSMLDKGEVKPIMWYTPNLP
jgi:branched-chain amino acid transport system substrate-binding protein